MALESIQVSAVIPASADRIFTAWLSSHEHTAFTGGAAKIEPRVGGRHTAWDGYIEGVNLALEEGRRILQTWRSSDFRDGSTDSRLEVLLEPAEGGTKVTLVHTDIPEGQGRLYEQGWVDNYITPMQEYFLEGEDDEGEGGDAPTAGDYAPPPAPLVDDEGWGDEPTTPPAPKMEAPGDEDMDDEPMEAPAAPAAKPKKKAPAKKQKKPAAQEKTKKKAPAKKQKKPAAKKKPAAAKKKKPAAQAKTKKKAPAKKKPAKKKGKR